MSIVIGFEHVALNCADLEKSVAFYRDPDGNLVELMQRKPG
jgi:catechol 2,3-dioxygenase-like lactoylglutathione lyase family enzyme